MTDIERVLILKSRAEALAVIVKLLQAGEYEQVEKAWSDAARAAANAARAVGRGAKAGAKAVGRVLTHPATLALGAAALGVGLAATSGGPRRLSPRVGDRISLAPTTGGPRRLSPRVGDHIVDNPIRVRSSLDNASKRRLRARH